MKRIITISACIGITALVLLFGISPASKMLNAQYDSTANNTGDASNYKWVDIDKFDQCLNWYVANSRYSEENFYRMNPVMMIYANAPQAIMALGTYDSNCLGLKCHIADIPSQPLAIIPRNPIDLAIMTNYLFPGASKPTPTYLGGPVARISMWVNGRNIPCKLRAYVQNSWEQIYLIELGSIEYWGWQRLDGDFVMSRGWGRNNAGLRLVDIRQHRWDQPNYKPMKILKFEIANPLGAAMPEVSYVYFDVLQAQILFKPTSTPDADIGAPIPERW